MITEREIRTYDVWDSDYNDLCLYLAQLESIKNGFSSLKMIAPEWFTDSLNSANRALAEKSRARKLAELKRLKAKRETLFTTNEQRNIVDTKITELESEVT